MVYKVTQEFEINDALKLLYYYFPPSRLWYTGYARHWIEWHYERMSICVVINAKAQPCSFAMGRRVSSPEAGAEDYWHVDKEGDYIYVDCVGSASVKHTQQMLKFGLEFWNYPKYAAYKRPFEKRGLTVLPVKRLVERYLNET